MMVSSRLTTMPAAGTQVRRARARRATLATLSVLTLLASCVPMSTSAPSTAGGTLVLATGGTQGVYYQYGTALAGRLETVDPNLEVTVVATTGSVENLTLLDGGEADCAFAAGDAAAEAVTGRPPFRRPAAITAVARVYDDYLHLVTRRDSDIRTLPDLPGHRVSLGPPASGTRLMVERLLDVAGITGPSIDDADLGINDSLAALERGEIDAFFWSGGVPTTGVRELGGRVPLRLLELDEYVPALRAAFDGVYRAAVVPVGTYGLDRSVATLAVPNELVCRSGVPAATVELVVKTLFDDRELMGHAVQQALSLDRRAAIETDPVPLHPAAAQWFRRTKP